MTRDPTNKLSSPRLKVERDEVVQRTNTLEEDSPNQIHSP